MDKAAKLIELDNQKIALENYLSNPVSVEFLRGLNEEQEALLTVLCNDSIVDIESFFKHFEGFGHLRALRKVKDLFTGSLETIKEEIQELESE